MKASICPKYGSPDVLLLNDVEKPFPKDNEVLIKVHSSTTSRTDLAMIQGKPKILRLFTGISKPKLPITGSDFVGTVEAIGKNVTAFKPGNRVMGAAGMGAQSHAQYMTFPENKSIMLIPEGMSFDQAVCCLEGAFYAIACIRHIKPKAGQTALVNGATGAIGSGTVQLLKYFGVHVTAVCSTENIGLVKSLGADRVIDYNKEDFTNDKEKYDFVIDAVGKSSFSKCKPILKPKGMYAPSDNLVNFLLTITTGLRGGKRVIFRAPKNQKEEIKFIRDLTAKGEFKTVIDRKYPLDKIREAFHYVSTGQKTGNVIVTIDETNISN
jgi:NADPH:quinone reductase-like Zn-dependent oxidoreductase